MAFSMNNTNSKSRTGRRRKSIQSEINVTPLVDVMLVLLIIFMVTSPMLVSGIHVDLPEKSAAPVSGQDEPLSITVESNGTVHLQDHEIKIEELSDKLIAVTNEKFDTRIFVRGDKNVDYGKVIEVIGYINDAGFSKVALVTSIVDKEEKSSR